MFGWNLTIPRILERAEQQFGSLSTEELDHLRFSRGHADTNTNKF